MDSVKKLTAAGCVLWIIGLIAFIAGMNLEGSVKDWMTTAGSIVFLLGLGISGYVWAKNRNETKTPGEDSRKSE